MRRVAALAGDPLVRPVIDSRQVATIEDVEKAMVPFGVDRLHWPATLRELLRRPITAVCRACLCSGVIGSP